MAQPAKGRCALLPTTRTPTATWGSGRRRRRATSTTRIPGGDKLQRTCAFKCTATRVRACVRARGNDSEERATTTAPTCLCDAHDDARLAPPGERATTTMTTTTTTTERRCAWTRLRYAGSNPWTMAWEPRRYLISTIRLRLSLLATRRAVRSPTAASCSKSRRRGIYGRLGKLLVYASPSNCGPVPTQSSSVLMGVSNPEGRHRRGRGSAVYCLLSAVHRLKSTPCCTVLCQLNL
ncbi:hypothetical protein C8R47DRAFT_306994 [Mycena vitilis]|nr:hypothetical protein C8R47DRAFT_306994 [Mycena vitilis]